ncbi:sugar ABC transporter ATP-binding protein [Cnuibacter physcomitrellae]|uniref:ABC transporter permease n=1 Tax=Cnuibacter physcomitrellae TaxID=1619308 RepID=A0A1X9LFM8_9MICO|nr:carbohydrate ABC transporter permease [Cnuibacter physcomitrellae]ARJ04006.1 ABC transporter permease [Cnuibacter physcomitrellae]MCS5497288.1 carbohydrate ABC transporter permease [Cnuibacter physcomitrellae]GGI40013.1 sugar ABC transporter ATP-binding protein [Cnuibacter physcomitrellae]
MAVSTVLGRSDLGDPTEQGRPVRPSRRPGGGQRAVTWILAITMIVVGLLMLLPIIWMMFTAFKPESDIVSYPPTLWPRELTIDHFIDVWNRIPFARLYVNTIVFAGGVTLISLLFDSMAAYALARIPFKGRAVVMVLILVLLMLPFQVTLIPLYDMLNGMGLTNTLPGLIIPRMTNAFGIFFLTQFFLSLPKDLEEAARVDGASEWRIYWGIVMPLARPALLTLGLFHFQYNWNDLLWPLVMSSSVETSTLPAGLSLFMGQHVVEYGLLMAGSLLSLVPVILFFLLIQRSFVAGIATTGLK